MACHGSISRYLSLVGSSLCIGKHHEKQTEKRPFSDDEPNIWSDFVYVWHSGFYPHGNLVKKRTARGKAGCN